MRRIVCLWIPQWPLQRWIVKQPQMAAAPIVLQGVDARQESRVIVCSAQACELGVRQGMPLMEARWLLEHASQHRPRSSASRQAPTRQASFLSKSVPRNRSQQNRAQRDRSPLHPSTHPSTPQWYLEDYDPELDREALLGLAQWCEQFSPLVGCEPEGMGHTGRQRGFDGTLFLDATPVAALFGGERAWGRKLLCDLASLGYGRPGYGMRLAIAGSIGAAWGVAHLAESLLHDSGISPFKSGESPAGSMAHREQPAVELDPPQPALFEQIGESFFWQISPGESGQQWLSQLPVAALRLPGEVLDKLGQLGVRTIAELERIGRSKLASRLGDTVPLRLGQFRGTIIEPIEVQHLGPAFEAQTWLEHPLTARESLTGIVRRLLKQLTEQLRSRGRGALQLECQLEKTCFQVGLYEPSACPRYLWELLQIPWERLQLPGPVAWLAVRAPRTVCTVHRQQELFASSLSDQVGREWTVLIERLSSRLGKTQVVRAELQTGAEPERAYRYVAWLDRSRRSSAEPAAHRPLHLLTKLQPLHDVELADDDTPRSFRCRQTRHQIDRCWGPERIVTSWWRQRTVARDYYQVETTTGARLWICQRHTDQAWFLHGIF